MSELGYSDILRLNRELATKLTTRPYRVVVLSNITTLQLNPILEYTLRSQGINATVKSGDYDNILQESVQLKDQADAVVVFWEPSNIAEGLHYKIAGSSVEEVRQLVDKVSRELEFLFQNLRSVPLVLMNEFTAAPFVKNAIQSDVFESFCTELNRALQTNKPASVVSVNLDKIFARLSIGKCVQYRDFASIKSLYTTAFFVEYARQVAPAIGVTQGKAKKVLIFDCDNTLWKGVLGEDGFQKIDMSGPFEEVQHLALELKKKGILLGLCSKNNPEDVDAVLRTHESMRIREDDLVIKKVNWTDKATNLRAIAKELNLGLDSIVFVDDSDFEANLIREQLPQVTVLQVPTRSHEYPRMLRDNFALFFSLGETEEDRARARFYKDQQLRDGERGQFSDIEGYLKSLEMKLKIFKNPKELVPRLAQMTQKTNQFNLTTRRYTEAEIEKLIDSHQSSVYAFAVQDKFGDSGVTGMAIVKELVDSAATGGCEIDALLLSCRILGRNLEKAFTHELLADLQQQDLRAVSARFIRTAKNDQVSRFYDQFGFTPVETTESETRYVLELATYQPYKYDYIEVAYDDRGRKA